MKLSRLRYKILILVLALACAFSALNLLGCRRSKNSGTAPPDGLTVNLMPEPLGVSINNMRFGWKMNDPDNNEAQTAYRIVIAETRDDFYEQSYEYDTGWVDSSLSTGVRIADINKFLKENSLYYWAVSTKDKDGNISKFSELSPFTTEVAGAWKSTRGIWAAENENKSEDSFVFLRSCFDISRLEETEKVTVSVTATDTESARQYVYNLYVNGNCVGIGPCRTNIDENGQEVLYYNNYDITEYLLSDKNVISTINYADSGKQFLCQVTAFYRDGSSEILLNSGSDCDVWKSLPADNIFGKDNSIGTGYYTAYANNIDANVYPFGFSETGFDDSDWNDCYLCGSVRENKILKSGEYYPVERFERVGAEIKELSDGDLLVDLKQEIVGGIKIQLDGESGDKIYLYYGEQLKSDGTVKWQMNTGNNYCEVFTLKDGEQTVETIEMLTYRYVQICGYDKPLRSDAVKGLEIRAGFDDGDSSFSSGSPLLNDIFDLTKNTIKYTTQDLMVDSQSRERACYEGDLLINALASFGVSSNYCSSRLSLEYALTHKTFEDYQVLLVVAAKYDYLYTGDDDVLIRYYNVLKEHCFALKRDNKYSLVYVENQDNIVIDWPQNDRDGYDMAAKYNTALNCIQYRAYTDFAFIAKIVGDEEMSAIAQSYAADLKESLIENLYDVEKGAFRDGLNADGTVSLHFAQQATAYALWAGVYDENMLQPMVAFVSRNDEIRTSVFGTYFLLDGLYKSGNGDKANVMLLNDDVSSGARTYAYMMRVMNATLTTEAWNEDIKDNMTLSHPWSASPAYFVSSGICGIEPVSPGFERFSLSPQAFGLGECDYEFNTVSGKIRMRISKANDGKTSMCVEVPANTSATVKIKCYDYTSVYVNGRNIEAGQTENYCVFQIGSGKTQVEYR